MVKVLIVYNSLFGANIEVAKLAKQSLERNGAEVVLRRTDIVTGMETKPNFLSYASKELLEIPIATNEDMESADAYVFSSPTHSSMMSASMKYFIDAHHDRAAAGKYMNKPFTAMTTTGFQHAGDEEVIEQFYAVAQHWGCLIVSVSITNAFVNKQGGNPYGLSFVVDDQGKLQGVAEIKKMMDIHFSRFVEISNRLVGLEPIEISDTSYTKKAFSIIDVLNK